MDEVQKHNNYDYSSIAKSVSPYIQAVWTRVGARFSVLQSVRTGSGAHSASHPNGYLVLFLWE
jgi:hypothetical protein